MKSNVYIGSQTAGSWHIPEANLVCSTDRRILAEVPLRIESGNNWIVSVLGGQARRPPRIELVSNAKTRRKRKFIGHTEGRAIKGCRVVIPQITREPALNSDIGGTRRSLGLRVR